MLDLISATFAAFEQRMQSDQDGIPLERIHPDDLLPAKIPCSVLIPIDSYASEPEKIMEEAENRKELYGYCGAYQNESEFICCTALALRMTWSILFSTALHFHLSESRARSTEALALDNLWLELPWWY